MRGQKINIYILCCVHDAVLIAENDDDLQRLLHQFNLAGKTQKMTI